MKNILLPIVKGVFAVCIVTVAYADDNKTSTKRYYFPLDPNTCLPKSIILKNPELPPTDSRDFSSDCGDKCYAAAFKGYSSKRQNDSLTIYSPVGSEIPGTRLFQP